jgi:2-hydroxychromene-2-carboxylate isomerase
VVPVGPEAWDHGPEPREAAGRPYDRRVLTLHFDYTSARAAVALLRLERLALAGHAVAFRGLDALGIEAVLPVTLDQLAEIEEQRARAGTLGLVLHRPTRRPPTLSAHLVGEVAEAEGVGMSWRRNCLEAYWTADADLSDREVLLGLATRTGLAASAVASVLDDIGRRNELRAQMLALRALGVGGVPVLEVDGTLLPADVDDATLLELTRL